MKKINILEFDFEKRNGEKIWCVELVSNDQNEKSIEIFECLNEEEAKKECQKMNTANQDNKYKYICICYTITKDGLEV